MDHDLGGKIYVESGPGTGYEVACWLEDPENKGHVPDHIVLHSLNTVGRKKMNMALPQAVDCPGAWLPGSDFGLVI